MGILVLKSFSADERDLITLNQRIQKITSDTEDSFPIIVEMKHNFYPEGRYAYSPEMETTVLPKQAILYS